MNFSKALFSRSVFWLSLIPLFALWGFWVTYFTRPGGSVAIHEHLHGVAMFGWLLMLVLQSYLIRTGWRSLHRRTGQLAWFLGPWIVVSTLLLAHYRLNARGMTPEGLYILGLQIFILIQYTVFLTLALRHRKRSDLHARWMICTAFPMLDPIFARILGIHFIQVPFETGIIQYLTYALTDLILLVLVVRDWQSEGRRDVFLPALGLLLVTQAFTLVALKVPAWTAFATWFAALPLP